MNNYGIIVTFLCSIAGCVLSTQVALDCEDGWIKYSGNCYLFVNSRLATATEVIDECNNYDASPLFFESPNELAWYKQQLSTYPSSAYWTSLNDYVGKNAQTVPGNGHWKWGMYSYYNTSWMLTSRGSKTSDTVTYFSTWSASPGNDGKALCGGVNVQGKMYDADCSSRQGYMCHIHGAAANGGCPPGWIPTDADCFYVSNVTDPSQLVSWQQAKQKCIAMNAKAHLVTIDDVNDQKFMQGQLPFLTQSPVLHWTGLQGSGQPGGWTWFNGVAFNQQLFTWATEPDNVAGIENCAVVRYNGKFSDRGCNSQQNYICKKRQPYMDTSFNLGCGSWARANTKCYQFFSDSQSSWPQAKQNCQTMGGDLININNKDILSWLQTQMLDPFNSNMFYWTALNDRDVEGTYRWGDGSLLDPNTINWDSEPNNWLGDTDCATIMANGEYFDNGCSFHAAPICELDNVQTCPSATGTGSTWVSRSADTGTGNNCYLFGNYKNTSQLKTWQEASDFCTSLAVQRTLSSGMPQTFVPKLLTVDTTAERAFIKQQLLKYTDNANNFWTGLTNNQGAGFWQWGNTMADTSLVEWHMEPSAQSPDMDCVYVGYGASVFTQKCGLKLGYICERLAYKSWSSAAGTASMSVFISATCVLLTVAIRQLL